MNHAAGQAQSFGTESNCVMHRSASASLTTSGGLRQETMISK
jgi:hypothetical protein